jgi:hypothetical protein
VKFSDKALALSFRWRQIFWKPQAVKETSRFRKMKAQGLRSEILLRAFYAFNFFIWLDFLRGFNFGSPDIIVARPLWPFFWMDTAAAPFWMSFFLVLNLAVSFLAMARPQSRTIRVLAFTGLFFFTALLNSDIAGWERMGSSAQDFVLIAFLFVFWPSPKVRAKMRAWQSVLLVVLAQMTLLASYVASAIWRLRATFSQLIAGQDLSIGSKALSQFIQIFSSNGGVSAVDVRVGHLSWLLEAHPMLAAPGMLLGTVFELSALYVIFRPRWYTTYGILLAIFHLGFILTMNLPFTDHFLLILLFLVCSPLNNFYASPTKEENL